MHVDTADHQEATTASIVAELPVGGIPVAHLLTGSPCRSSYVTVPVDGSWPEGLLREG